MGRIRNPPSRRAPALDWTSEPLVRAARAAVVVEDRYCQVFKLERVRPALVADGLAGLHIYKPYVQIVFCETRQLAEELPSAEWSP